jgi:hypothetical protein
MLERCWRTFGENIKARSLDVVTIMYTPIFLSYLHIALYYIWYLWLMD